MIQMTGNAAASIAARNAVLAGIPRAVWEEYFKMAVNVVSGGNEQTLVKKRAAAMETVLKFGITHERLFARLEIKGPEEMMPEHLLRLRGLLNAIRDGDTTVDKAFPEVGSTAKPVEEEQQGQGMAGLKETLRKQSDCGSAAVIAVGGAAGASARPWMGRWTCLRPLKVPEDTTKPEKADAPSEPKPTYEAPARQMCAHTACMKESREGSLFCEDHGPAPAEKPKRKRKDDVPAAQD
jgi:hypothetical protein